MVRQAEPGHEKRQLSRIPCSLPLSHTAKSAPLGEISDTSLDGLFVRTSAPLSVGANLPIAFTPKKDQPEIRAQAEVVRITHEGMGLRFLNMSGQASRRLRRLATELTDVEGHKHMATRLMDTAGRATTPITDAHRIDALLQQSIVAKTPFTLIPADCTAREQHHLTQADATALVFRGSTATQLKAGDTIFAMCTMDFVSYSFPCQVHEADGELAHAHVPTSLFYSERRSSKRDVATQDVYIRIPLPWKDNAQVSWQVFDTSPQGLSFRVAASEARFLPGTPLPNAVLSTGDETVPLVNACVKHLTLVRPDDGDEWLGCLADADYFCRDMQKYQVATLEDARTDMAKIKADITWVLGTEDALADPRRVHDIMSVAAPKKREIIEVNAGHLPRTGDEALAQFALITQKMWKHLFGRDIQAQVPSRGWLAAMAKTEWDRTYKSSAVNSSDYWRTYLLGTDGLGFDILNMSPKYRGLVDTQVRLAQASGKHVLDVGPGTGNVTEALAKSGVASITACDLVAEALERLKDKVRPVMHIHTTACNIDGTATTLMRRWVEGDYSAGGLPFAASQFDAIVCSLVLSYLNFPDDTLFEMHRVLKPGGRLVISSMKHDADTSKIYFEVLQWLHTAPEAELPEGKDRQTLIEVARNFSNSAAELLRIEEEGAFRFYSGTELVEKVCRAGFHHASVTESFGDPGQAIVVTCDKL